MKAYFLVLLTTVLFTQSLYAVSTHCATTAAEAAFKLARPQGNNSNSSFYVSVERADLVKKVGSTLYYRVEVHFDVNDGYSDAFPVETYSVVASGSEQMCRVTAIKLIK